MENIPADGHGRTSTRQVLRRLKRMVDAGRVSRDDAARLRRAAESGGLDEALAEIRRKHAEARIVGAVESRRLTSEEAKVVLGRLEDGEDPRGVVRGLPRLRRGRDVDHLPESQERHDG